MNGIRKAAACGLACTLIAGGCVPRTSPALYAAPDLFERTIDAVAVAPVVDERSFAETRIPIATYARETAARVLDGKGYETAVMPGPNVTRIDEPLLDADADTLLRLQSGTDSPFVLWIGIDRVETESTGIGLDTWVRLTAVLVDATAREVLWRNRAVRESSVSGAGFGTISPAVRTYQAVYRAVSALLESLPDQNRRGEGSGTPRPAYGPPRQTHVG